MDRSSMVPVRTTEHWDSERVESTRRVTIIREREARNRLDRFLFDVFDTPTERELELDAVGSAVWLGCDGATTVDELAEDLAAEFPNERIEPVGETLSYFLAQLSELDLIRYEEPADERTMSATVWRTVFREPVCGCGLRLRRVVVSARVKRARFTANEPQASERPF